MSENENKKSKIRVKPIYDVLQNEQVCIADLLHYHNNLLKICKSEELECPTEMTKCLIDFATKIKDMYIDYEDELIEKFEKEELENGRTDTTE